MNIYFDEKEKIFHLQSENMSYIMQVMKDGYLTHLYWGKKVKTYHKSNPIIFIDRGFSPNPCSNDRTFSLDTIPNEYPAYGNGDFRSPAYQIELENGSAITDLRYVKHEIYNGKRKLNGLPAVYVESEDEAKTLDITMEDKLIGLTVILSYTVFRDFNAIARSVQFKNNGKGKIKILKALSASVDFRSSEYDVLTFHGAHTNERNIDRRPLAFGIQMVESCRGASSPQHDPFIALLQKNADEDYGEVYAFNFVYSGNFIASAQVDQFKNTRVSMGINPFNFSWLLEQNESFQTPEVVMVYSCKGLGYMSRTYNKLYQNRVCRGKFRDKVRPILINNWEATYFDFNADKIVEIASEAKKLGIELMVLDDGWFGKRDDDFSSLGDWVVNKKKLPDGLVGLAERIHSIGMKFGLWFEPEMISENSDLYRKHPDWCLHVPDRPYTYGRSQLVLDLSREDVCNYIIEAVTSILYNAPIDYVKWDMNRHMTEIGSSALPPERQRETAHRYMLGLYKILEEITARFPNTLFESCSSGGGRFDAGMLYYMPQTWASDNTDAICRLKIQYGTSMVYPISSIGAHVSTVPNHQIGRITPISTRGHVAMSGNLGYELDVTKLSKEDKEFVKLQINTYKEIREIIQFGDFYRILSPFKGNETAWNFVSRDKSEVVGYYFNILSQPAAAVRILKFKGLDAAALYKNMDTKEVFYGDELMNVGISIPIMREDFSSLMWRFKKVN